MKQSIISFMTSSAFLLFANGAKASSVVVNMDKGTLLVELASIEKAYDLKVVKPASCHDLPRVTDLAGVVNISHKDLEECPEGSVVTLTVNPALVTSVNLKLENGLAGVNNFKTFYKSLQSLKSSVNV